MAASKWSYNPNKVAAHPSASNGAPEHENADKYKKGDAWTPKKSSYDDEIEH